MIVCVGWVCFDLVDVFVDDCLVVLVFYDWMYCWYSIFFWCEYVYCEMEFYFVVDYVFFVFVYIVEVGVQLVDEQIGLLLFFVFDLFGFEVEFGLVFCDDFLYVFDVFVWYLFYCFVYDGFDVGGWGYYGIVVECGYDLVEVVFFVGFYF